MYLSMTLIGEVPSSKHPSKCSEIVRVVREGITIFMFLFVCLFFEVVVFLFSFVLFLFLLSVLFFILRIEKKKSGI